LTSIPKNFFFENQIPIGKKVVKSVVQSGRDVRFGEEKMRWFLRLFWTCGPRNFIFENQTPIGKKVVKSVAPLGRGVRFGEEKMR
jgi:hypothetical protein